jgi:Amidohydrolase family
VTSTLAVFESFTGSDEASNGSSFSPALRLEMAFERTFFAAGGRLLAGADPTGWGGVLAGFGDQRGLELLVLAGLSPENAIRVATSSGAAFMRQSDIGRIEPGYRTDLVVLQGDPTQHIADIRKVETVFKGGVAYDPAPLIAAAQGTIGVFEISQLLTWPVVTGVSLVAVIVVRRTRRGS